MAAIADGEGNWQWHSDQRLQEYIADILPKAAQVHPLCSATTGPLSLKKSISTGFRKW